MPDPTTALAIIDGALNPALPSPTPTLTSAPPAPSGPVAGSAQPDASTTPAGYDPLPAGTSWRPVPGITFSDDLRSKLGGQLVGVSDRQYLPPGLNVPDGATFPMEIQVPAAGAPQSFPVVAAPPGLPPMPGGTPSPAATAPAPASPLATPAPADTLAQKMAVIDAALAAPTAKAPPVVPTTGPASTAKPSIAPYYDRASDTMVNPSANGATPQTGYVANTAAGGNAAAANTLGAPVDLTTGALNLVPRAINAVAGTNLPTMQNPVGGSQWIQSAMGLIGADPRNVVPGSFGEQMARTAAGGAVSALLPAGVAGRFVGAADPVAAGVAQSMAQAPRAAAVSGAAAGVGGTLATDAARHAGVPEAAMPYIDLAGQLVGGGLGAAGASTAISSAQGVRSDGSKDVRVSPEGRETVDYEIVQRSKLKVDSRKWLLSKLLPKVYGDKIETTNTNGLMR